jgi:dihydrodipicolinate synthase/N-acetylneuraminate lyase
MVASLTPLDKEGRLDSAGLETLLNWQVSQGVDSVFVLGIAGECHYMDLDTRTEVVKQAAAVLARRKPLLAGVFGDSARMVLRNIESYAAGHADYVITSPPGLLPLSQPECERFYLEVADHSPLPLLPYNCLVNRNQLEPDTVVRLAGHPNVAGLKDTSNEINLARLQLRLSQRNDFALLSGHEYLFLGALALGIHGFVMGGPANMFPGLCRRIRDDYQRGDHESARAKFLEMVEFMDAIYTLPCGALPAVKAVMELMGVMKRHMAAPLRSANDGEVARVREAMQRSGLFPEYSFA